MTEPTWDLSPRGWAGAEAGDVPGVSCPEARPVLAEEPQAEPRGPRSGRPHRQEPEVVSNVPTRRLADFRQL